MNPAPMNPAHRGRAHWPRGLHPNNRVPALTLPEVLDWATRRHPDRPAIVFGGSACSYRRLQQRVAALAGFLQHRLGVQAGDRVLLMGQNCPQWVTAFYGVVRAGAVVVPASPMGKRSDVAHLLRDSGARLAIVAQELLDSCPWGDAADELPRALVFAYGEALAPGLPPPDPWPEGLLDPLRPLASDRQQGFEAALAEGLAPAPDTATPDALVVLPYTSGTTGYPKGVRHSHHTVLASLAASARWRGLNDDAVVLTVAPLFHMLGQQNGMHMPLWLGGTSVMLPRWNPAVAAQLIERHRVTVWTAPPAMVQDFFAQPAAQTQDLSSLSLLSGGGAAMPEAVAAMLAERFGLFYNEAYGLTESAAFLLANPLHRGKRQCLGVVTPGVDARIIDPDTGAELPPGETGELVVRGEQLMLGYWQHPRADAQAWTVLDGQRFFRTGDLAWIDPEGYFFMRDRLKRMVNVSGYKVWPAEVETLLHQHPDVLEACVIAMRDERGQERVKALVVLRPGATPDEAGFIAWCREHLAAYKVPRGVAFLPALPKSSTGKVMWRALQQAEHDQALSTAAQKAKP